MLAVLLLSSCSALRSKKADQTDVGQCKEKYKCCCVTNKKRAVVKFTCDDSRLDREWSWSKKGWPSTVKKRMRNKQKNCKKRWYSVSEKQPEKVFNDAGTDAGSDAESEQGTRPDPESEQGNRPSDAGCDNNRDECCGSDNSYYDCTSSI